MKKKKVSYRHIVVATMDLRLLLSLIERGVLTKFLDNCVKGIWYQDTMEWITRKFNHTTLKKQIVGIEDYFSWARSPEGYSYWNDLFNEFYHEYS